MKVQPFFQPRRPTVRRMASALCGTVLAAWGLMLLSGCGHSGPEVVPVRGRVTFGGGDWPKPGVLYFTVDRAAAGFPGRPGTGHFDTDGNLTVTTFTKGDGLIPGHYKIGVECWEVTPVMGSSGPPRMYVPAKYQSPGSSGLELTVEPGQSLVEVSFDIPKR